MNWLENSDTALAWFCSYLSDRLFSSSPDPLSCGVPQGSILGPLLFSVYMLHLSQIIRRYNINVHCYANDTLLYVPLTCSDIDTFSHVMDRLSDIKCCMSQNFFRLNNSKSEVPPKLNFDLKNNLGNLSSNNKSSARNLGVIFDSVLTYKSPR